MGEVGGGGEKLVCSYLIVEIQKYLNWYIAAMDPFSEIKIFQ
jgi:hypothetical protein